MKEMDTKPDITIEHIGAARLYNGSVRINAKTMLAVILPSQIHKLTEYQLHMILKEAARSVIFPEHDPILYDQVWEMITPIAGVISEISHGTTLIIYSLTADRAFSVLTFKALHLV